MAVSHNLVFFLTVANIAAINVPYGALRYTQEQVHFHIYKLMAGSLPLALPPMSNSLLRNFGISLQQKLWHVEFRSIRISILSAPLVWRARQLKAKATRTHPYQQISKRIPKQTHHQYQNKHTTNKNKHTLPISGVQKGRWVSKQLQSESTAM